MKSLITGNIYTPHIEAIEKKLLKGLINIDKANVTICVLPTSDLEHLDQELFGTQCKEIYHDLIARTKKKVYSNEKRMSIEKLLSVCKIQQLYTSDKDISPKTAQNLKWNTEIYLLTYS